MLEQAVIGSLADSKVFSAIPRAVEAAALALVFLVPPLTFLFVSTLGAAFLGGRNVPEIPRSRVSGYLLGFAVFGSCLGLLAGWPADPLLRSSSLRSSRCLRRSPRI